jgi:diguanylate cyclase (GGDEF)-like protein
MDDELVFAPEESEPQDTPTIKRKILIVDDDTEVHSFTKLALKDFAYENVRLEFLSAYSKAGATEILNEHDDIAVILLDVVMETNFAGLEIAKFVRHELKNNMVRIIIRTGQPGEAPERYVIENYDINDYKEKTELTADKLYTTIRTALAQYQQLLDIVNKKDEIYQMLITDELTGLPNRNKLNKDIDSDKHQTLMLIDIDNFSMLNDSYGFEVGDQLLLHIRDILLRLLKKNMKLYRLEADLFAIVLTDPRRELLTSEVDTIKAVLDNTPMEKGKLSIYLNISIGIVQCQIGNIIQKAELALRQARKISKNRVEYYHDSLDIISNIEENNSWTARIASALAKDKILVYYQPIVECATNKIVKYECLVRLEHKDTVYSPYHFLKTARFAGYLHILTQRVFEKACQKFQYNDFKFSINITDHDLAEDKFIDFINTTAQKYNINSSRIVFEVLEDTSMGDNILATENLGELLKLGYSLSIDDFGTQCSNFAQLGKHQYESIKIDGKFIKDINENEQSNIITESILFFADKINCDTVAEFVHSKEIYDIIKNMGVTYAQGYFFGEPTPELVSLEA